MTDKSTSDFIKTHENMLALAVVEKLYMAYPQLESKYGLAGRKKCLQDSIYHLQYLAEAIGSASPVLFEDYIGWAETMLVSRHVPSDDLKKTLELMREVLQAHLPETGWPAAARCLDGALNNLPGISGGRGSYMLEESPLGELAGSYLKALLDGNRQAASQLVLEAVEQGVEVKDVYIDVFQSSQQELGRLWQTNQVSVAQEHYCTAATQMVMSQLYSHVFATPKNGRRMVGTSVGGNLHEIGMRMVTDFLELEGWDTYYLGANTPPWWAFRPRWLRK